MDLLQEIDDLYIKIAQAWILSKEHPDYNELLRNQARIWAKEVEHLRETAKQRFDLNSILDELLK